MRVFSVAGCSRLDPPPCLARLPLPTHYQGRESSLSFLSAPSSSDYLQCLRNWHTRLQCLYLQRDSCSDPCVSLPPLARGGEGVNISIATCELTCSPTLPAASLYLIGKWRFSSPADLLALLPHWRANKAGTLALKGTLGHCLCFQTLGISMDTDQRVVS